MVPGMTHCQGGAGPNSFDALTALERWRENGTAPEKLIAAHSTANVIDNSRPLCPYPQAAIYKGSGNTTDAGNYTCGNPPTGSDKQSRHWGVMGSYRPAN